MLAKQEDPPDLITYALVIARVSSPCYFMQANRMIPRMIVGQLVPICAYVVMAHLAQPGGRRRRRPVARACGLYERRCVHRHRRGRLSLTPGRPR
ncbi:MAG: hypothetical protein ACLTSX_08705 [Collinsella sp.]